MTLDEAISAFERDFTVCRDIGLPDDEMEGRADWSRAPTGERYITLVSGGQTREGTPTPALYAGEELAAEEWLRQAWTYAEARGGKTLYWRERPIYTEAEFVAVDQVSLMNDPRMRSSITICVGYVHSRLLVSKAGDKDK